MERNDLAVCAGGHEVAVLFGGCTAVGLKGGSVGRASFKKPNARRIN